MSTELPQTRDAEYGILGLTLRELLIVGVWIVSFAVSFVPLVGAASLWAVGVDWVLPVALPALAVFLIVLRRFSPGGIRRVGSLGIDQFASVVFSVSAFLWFGYVWRAISTQVEFGVWTLSWSAIVLLFTALALVALTVFAPLIPGLKQDFDSRPATYAHRNANPVRPVMSRPRPEVVPVIDEAPAGADAPSAAPAPAAAPEPSAAPVPMTVPLDVELSGDFATDEVARLDIAEQVPLAAHASSGDTGAAKVVSDDEYVPTYSRRSRNQEIVSDTASIESLLETAARVETGEISDAELPVAVGEPVAIESAPTTPTGDAAAQPFWILAPTEREVHDVQGATLFTIGPNAWTLVIEDRGGAYVVRHDDGRVGFLHDIADVTKG